MSTEQPDPQHPGGTGGGGADGHDPFRKPGAEGDPRAGDPRAGGPYGGHPGGERPYDNPYGGAYGAADPLAGMPPLANRGKRLLARIVDALIVGIPLGVIMGLIWGWRYDETNTAFAQSGVYTLVYVVYEALMLSSSGQTLGKKLMRVRVAMLRDGAVPRGGPAWIRALVYSLPTYIPCLGTIFWLVNVLFCTWDRPYRQCLHDKAAKTVVVEAR